jgi:acyl-CoA thioester hydrolase
MDPQDFRHRTTLITRFSDADMLWHVNNAKYVTYIEEARIHYAKDVLGWDNTPHQIGMILVKTVIDYLLPLGIEQTIHLYTRCSRVGRKSFDLSYLMLTADESQLVAIATTTMVSYDYNTNTSVLLSDEWRQKIMTYEKIPPTEG